MNFEYLFVMFQKESNIKMLSLRIEYIYRIIKSLLIADLRTFNDYILKNNMMRTLLDHLEH